MKRVMHFPNNRQLLDIAIQMKTSYTCICRAKRGGSGALYSQSALARPNPFLEGSLL